MRALAKQERCRAPVFTDEPWGRDQCTAKVQECRFWRASARSLWRVPRRVERDRRMARRSVQECHCGISADPGAGSCEGDVDPVVCIGDDRKGRQEVPKAAPGCGGNTPTCDDRGCEHDIDGVRRSGGKHHACGQERIEGEHRHGLARFALLALREAGNGTPIPTRGTRSSEVARDRRERGKSNVGPEIPRVEVRGAGHRFS